MLSIFYQFDPEEEDGSRQGKITKDNFVMCLQTISKLLSQQKCTFVIFFADLKVRKYTCLLEIHLLLQPEPVAN